MTAMTIGFRGGAAQVAAHLIVARGPVPSSKKSGKNVHAMAGATGRSVIYAVPARELFRSGAPAPSQKRKPGTDAARPLATARPQSERVKELCTRLEATRNEVAFLDHALAFIAVSGRGTEFLVKFAQQRGRAANTLGNGYKELERLGCKRPRYLKLVPEGIRAQLT